jgi:hypothetical protein
MAIASKSCFQHLVEWERHAELWCQQTLTNQKLDALLAKLDQTCDPGDNPVNVNVCNIADAGTTFSTATLDIPNGQDYVDTALTSIPAFISNPVVIPGNILDPAVFVTGIIMNLGVLRILLNATTTNANYDVTFLYSP